MPIAERLFVGILGALCLSVGIHVLWLGEATSAWRVVGGLVLCAIGGNAILGAATGRRPWMSRIGPLP